MRTLTLSTGSFDRVNTFTIRMPRVRYPATASLHSGFKTADDGLLWIMQHGAMLCDSYSPEQVAERERLNAEPPVCDGDEVEVSGRRYRVRILGDYSDAGRLDPVAVDYADDVGLCGEVRPEHGGPQ